KRERRIVAAHPNALVLILAARGVLDVVADIERIVDAGAQLFVEVAPVGDAAADPGNAEGARAGAPRGDVGTEGHGRAVEVIGPLVQQIGERGLLELFDKDHIVVGLNAYIAGVEGAVSSPRRGGTAI